MGASIRLRSGGVRPWTRQAHYLITMVACAFALLCMAGAAVAIPTVATISDNTIINNTAQYGGGICCISQGVVVERNIIKTNTALQGAGLYTQCGAPTVTGNMISGNVTGAGGTGGGILCSLSPAFNIVNNTFVANNSPNGGAIASSESSPVLANNIIAFNTGTYGGIMGSGTGTLTLMNNDVYSNGVNPYYPTTIPHTTDIALDPLFKNYGGGDYHLSFYSPCRDAGFDTASGMSTLDIDLETRKNGIVDIGADEFWDTVPPTVFGITPINAATLIPPTTTVTATFSEDMAPATITNATFTLTQGGVTVPAAVSYAPLSKTATLTPSSSLAYNTMYTVTLTSGVTDLSGNALASAPYTWSFTTHGPIGSIRTYANGTNVSFGPVVVNGVFPHTAPAPTWVYVQDLEGTAGIRVHVPSTTLTVGQKVNVTGQVQTDGGERYISIASGSITTVAGSQTVSALGMRPRWVGGTSPGGNLPYAQGCEGYYNVGLLVHTWGWINSMYSEGSERYIRVSDGSDVQVTLPPGMAWPGWGYVRMTGISGVIWTLDPCRHCTYGFYPTVRVRPIDSIEYISKSDGTINRWHTWSTGGQDGISLVNGTNYLAMPGIPRSSSPDSVFAAASGYPAFNLEGSLNKWNSYGMWWSTFGYGCQYEPFGPCRVSDAFQLEIPQSGNYRYNYQGIEANGPQLINLGYYWYSGPFTTYFGSPYDAQVRWNVCRITNGITNCLMSDSAAANWMSAIYRYDNPTHTWVQLTANDLANGYMEPRSAYRMTALAGNLALIVPGP